jgi:hypothetical protein
MVDKPDTVPPYGLVSVTMLAFGGGALTVWYDRHMPATATSHRYRPGR